MTVASAARARSVPSVDAKAGSPVLEGRGRRIKRAEVAVGLLIVVGCALGAVVVHMGSVERTSVLAARHDIDEGQVIGTSDLEVVNVASDGAVAHVTRDDLDDVVGRRAAAPIVVGQLLTEVSTTAEATVGPDEAALGLALLPGQLPSLDLSPGDRVHVVAAPPSAEQRTEAADPVLTRSAEILAIEDLDADRRLVTLLTSEADAERVAAAAGDDSLRLVVVAS